MSAALSDYDYELPHELIATRPLTRRDDARMMVLHCAEQRIEHRHFRELPEFVEPGDRLVLNNTRVLRARRFSDDGAVELLVLEAVGARRWKCLVRPGRKMRFGAAAQFGGVRGTVVEICAEGERIIELEAETDLSDSGILPLPPYMRRESDPADEEQYQTVFASVPGALAAPTAGLHFTPELLARLPHTFVTLHVGTGTFRPVLTENIAEHQMHVERFSISGEAADAINDARRVLAIGTTSLRVLEAAARRDGKLIEQAGETNIFIFPPYVFHGVDRLLTNFHLPRSTLLMLVSAFADREFILRAYAEAVREQYRFFSYGDCMLLL